MSATRSSLVAVDEVEVGNERLDDLGDRDLAPGARQAETGLGRRRRRSRPSSGPPRIASVSADGASGSVSIAPSGVAPVDDMRSSMRTARSRPAPRRQAPRRARDVRLQHVRQLDAEEDQRPREVEREDREEDESEGAR